MQQRKTYGLCGVLALLLSGFSAKAESNLVQTLPVTTEAFGIKSDSTLFVPLPKPSDPLVRRPVLVLLHSGFFGDQASLNEMAMQVAQLGVLVAVPSYRGEPRWIDGKRSEGRVEFCSGEVDDVQNLLSFLKTRADVDPLRIALLGMSHGACIALRVAEREPSLRAVAILSGPVEIGFVERSISHHLLHGLWLEPMVLTFVGGTYPEKPDAYKARSPLYRASKLIMPLFVAQGTADDIVPPVQACWLAEVLERSGHLLEINEMDAAGSLEKNKPDRCTFSRTVSSSPALPKVELWFMQNQGHSYGSIVRTSIQARALQFVLQELGHPGFGVDLKL